jgi:hypothetical protein
LFLPHLGINIVDLSDLVNLYNTQPVNFVEASERLKRSITDDEIAEATGVSTNTIRRTRADPSTRNYRPPPSGWQAVFSRLARERARDLDALARELDAAAEDLNS